jgi:hypothetical protein
MMHPGRFKDQVMVVTGAAQGIGRGVALAAAGEGARLVLADSSPLVHEVAREAAALGALVVVVEADLETWAGASKLAARARGLRRHRHPGQQRRRDHLGQALPGICRSRDRGRDPPFPVPDPVVLPRRAAGRRRRPGIRSPSYAIRTK